MKTKILLSMLVYILLVTICSCSNKSLKEKTLNQEIISGKVIKTIPIGRGDFFIVYRENSLIDSIVVLGFGNYDKKIDTQTVLNKYRLSSSLNFKNLKDKEGGRYSSSINLIYW